VISDRIEELPRFPPFCRRALLMMTSLSGSRRHHPFVVTAYGAGCGSSLSEPLTFKLFQTSIRCLLRTFANKRSQLWY
jgi:hypothetical protein